MDRYFRAQEIKNLKYLVQMWKQSPPDISWCDSYVTMRRHLRKLGQYTLCPVYFERMLAVVVQHEKEGNKIPLYVLTTIKTWFNKAKGPVQEDPLSHGYVPPDFTALLGDSYAKIAEHLFYFFRSGMNSSDRMEVVQSFITGMELSQNGQEWLVQHWYDHNLILNKLLRYPVPSGIITTWARHIGLRDGALLHRLPEVVGRILDYDPAFLLTTKDLEKLMEQAIPLWKTLRRFYNETAKDALAKMEMQDDPFSKPTAAASHIDSQGNLQVAGDALDWLEDTLHLHPNEHYKADWLLGLHRMGLKFKVFSTMSQDGYASINEFAMPPSRRWYEFFIKAAEDSFDAVYHGQSHYSIRNFYITFPYIDIEASVKEWKEQAVEVRDSILMWAIYRSRLPLEKKTELYQRYYRSDIRFPMNYVIAQEKNSVMAEWLIEKLKRKGRK